MTTENQTNVLEQLVGEDKKFKSVEALAVGKVEADAFIETLKNQINMLKEEIGKLGNSADRTKTLENLMSSLANTTKPGETPAGNQPQEPSNQSTAGLSHDDVVKIVEARERAAAEARNLATALAPFKKVYGDKSDEVLAQKAAALGLTVEALQSLAKSSPAAFLNVVGVNNRDNSTRPMANHSSVNATGATDPGAPSMRKRRGRS